MIARSSRHGFTFLEMAVVGATTGLLFLLLSQSFTGSSRLAASTHLALSTSDDARRSLDALANVLRGASWDAMDGFDEVGQATTPVFQRVVSVNAAGAAVLGPPERIEWRAMPAPVDGIAQPGRLVHVGPVGEAVIAPRVPQGGFAVRLEGRQLRITLTTWHATSSANTSTVTLQTTIALRN